MDLLVDAADHLTALARHSLSGRLRYIRDYIEDNYTRYRANLRLLIALVGQPE